MAAPEPATPDPAMTPAPSAYALVLPPGWSRIPLRHGTERAITGILDRSFAGLPRDKVAALRRELHLRLRDLSGRARESSGLDLYVPTEQMHGVTATASFVVAEMSLFSAEPVDPALLVARLVADSQRRAPWSSPGRRGPGPNTWLRRMSNRASSMRRAGSTTCCRSRPTWYRWVVVSFSTLGAGDPTDEFAQLLVELFDAIMTTFRWRRP